LRTFIPQFRVGATGAAVSAPRAWNPTDLGALLTDNWVSGERQYTDSGATTPVTAAGQTVASWVGVNGTKLTTTGGAMKAVSVGGVLTPVSISDAESAWVVPGGVSLDSRDFVAWLHCRSGSGWLGGFVGLGSGRGREISTFTDIRWDVFNPAGGDRYPGTGAPFASPMVLGLEGGLSTVTLRQNAAAWATGTPYDAGTTAGGHFGALYDGTTKGTITYHGLCLTKVLDATNRGLLLGYFDSRVARPSDTAPALNIAALGDSNTCGTLAGGVSWPWLWGGANSSARFISSSKSGQFFSAGGSPINGATNTTRINAQRLAGAGRNIIVIADTNDFTSLSAATCLSNRETWATARQAEGWEVWQPYMPVRIAPYSDAVTYTATVQAFNTLLASSTAFDRRPDLYTASGGATPTGGLFDADGIHWTGAMQSLVYTTFVGAL
jgi:hypothetical protein